jgi:hypothetical protein
VCGVVRFVSMGDRFLVVLVDHLEPDGAAEHLLERTGVPVSGPELELRVAAGVKSCQVVVGGGIELDVRERLRVAAIQALGEPHHRRQRVHGAPRWPTEVAKALVSLLRRRLPMIAGDERDHLDLAVGEAGELITKAQSPLRDLSAREITVMVPFVVLIFWMGIFPNHFLDWSKPSIEHLVNSKDYYQLTFVDEKPSQLIGKIVEDAQASGDSQ